MRGVPATDVTNFKKLTELYDMQVHEKNKEPYRSIVSLSFFRAPLTKPTYRCSQLLAGLMPHSVIK